VDIFAESKEGRLADSSAEEGRCADRDFIRDRRTWKEAEREDKRFTRQRM
jgi:hypothetical protein